MKRSLIAFALLFCLFILSFNSSSAQTIRYSYTRPSWTISIGPAWALATNDAYGRANYANPSEVLRDNYGMRWGWGSFLIGKYSPGKLKNDRIFLGVDYKSMTNSDFNGGDTNANETHYNIVSIEAGYEYLFYGTYNFRSFYGAGLTGNFISGSLVPKAFVSDDASASFESSFRVGMELKAGLEFIFNTSRKNMGLSVGAKYNLTNLFNSSNADIVPGQTENLNDGSDAPGPGYKRYIGIVSIEVGLTLYPDVKKILRK